MKKGLREFTAKPTDIHVGAVLSLPDDTPESGGTRGLPWGMLGNDRWGDCYWASAAHEHQAIRSRVDRYPDFTDDGVIDTYRTFLGLPADKALDQDADEGTDAREGAKYRRDHGVQDARGHDHYIGAYAFETDPRQLPSLIHQLGAVTICVELTQDCETAWQIAYQNGDDFVWDIGGVDSEVVGGHAVAGTYWTPGGIGVVSWGREGIITYDYMERYMWTAVVYFSRGMLTPGSNENPLGLDKGKLVDLVKEARS